MAARASTGAGSSALGAHNVLVLVGRSLYDAFGNLCGMVGLTPIEFVAIAAGGAAVFVLVHVYQAVRGRGAWSIARQRDPDEEPVT